MSCVSFRCEARRVEKKQHRFVLVPRDCHIRRLSNFMPIVYYPLSYALHVECSYFRFTVCSSSFTDGIFAKAVNADCRLPNRVSDREKTKRENSNRIVCSVSAHAHVLAYNFPSFFFSISLPFGSASLI